MSKTHGKRKGLHHSKNEESHHSKKDEQKSAPVVHDDIKIAAEAKADKPMASGQHNAQADRFNSSQRTFLLKLIDLFLAMLVLMPVSIVWMDPEFSIVPSALFAALYFWYNNDRKLSFLISLSSSLIICFLLHVTYFSDLGRRSELERALSVALSGILVSNMRMSLWVAKYISTNMKPTALDDQYKVWRVFLWSVIAGLTVSSQYFVADLFANVLRGQTIGSLMVYYAYIAAFSAAIILWVAFIELRILKLALPFVGLLSTIGQFLNSIRVYVGGFFIGYGIIIILFAHVYLAIEIAHPNLSFNMSGGNKIHESLSLGDFLYFSTQTITTIGYSDLSPGNAIVKVITVVEIFFGLVWTLFVFGMISSKIEEERKAVTTNLDMGIDDYNI